MDSNQKKRGRDDFESEEASTQSESSRKKHKKPIRDYINEYSRKSDAGAQEILQALEHTKIFLLQTSLQFQANREKVITPEEILKILDSAASKLAVLDKVKTKDERALEMLAYCKDAIEDQLKLLHDFNDKIYNYYQSNDNPLKRVLETPANTLRPGGGNKAAG